MVEDEWILFDKRRLPTVREPLVTKQANNNFSYNHSAHVALGEPEAIELLFNEKRQEVGFRAADLSQPHVYPVRKQQNSTNYQFSGIAFASAFGIPKGETLRFKAELRGDMLVIDLKNPRGDASRRRGQKLGKSSNERTSTR